MKITKSYLKQIIKEELEKEQANISPQDREKARIGYEVGKHQKQIKGEIFNEIAGILIKSGMEKDLAYKFIRNIPAEQRNNFLINLKNTLNKI